MAFGLLHVLAVGGTEDLLTAANRALGVVLTTAQFAHNASLFKFLFEPLQSLVNALVFFYVDDDHAEVWVVLSERSAKVHMEKQIRKTNPVSLSV